MPLLTYAPIQPINDPYSTVEWEVRDAVIKYGDGTESFRQNSVTVPKSWSQLALNVVASKYLRGYVGKDGTPGQNRETSIRQLIDRVVDTIAGWAGYVLEEGEPTEAGWTKVRVQLNLTTLEKKPIDPMAKFDEGFTKFNAVTHKRPKGTLQDPCEVYFQTRTDWENWKNDLKYIFVNQMACFNSPVWFNVGVDEHPQCSACFIVRMNDFYENEGDKPFDMNAHGLLAAQVKEGIIFSKGSGSGINLSRVRSSKEWLSGGGRPSGPLSFAEGLDAWATVTKSGGKTRRAAKMLTMDVDHPDIREFIRVKAEEEKIAKALIAAGYPADMDGVAYRHARHQNSNLSGRASDAFMRAVDGRQKWALISRSKHHLTGKLMTSMIGKEGYAIEEVNAYELMKEIGQTCWESGDPGIQFSDTINQWHTCANEEPIVATNPCSEYVFLDETACNLASLNLAKFYVGGKNIDAGLLAKVSEAVIIAMEVLVSNSRYPTENFARMSHRYRTLGLGFANLGGLLIRMGIPYDSEEACTTAGLLASLITARAYRTSARIAECIGPFEAFEKNRSSFLNVMRKHRQALKDIEEKRPAGIHPSLFSTSMEDCDRVVDSVETGIGVRNAQATVIAPTGTIAFMMDCETTGIEPELALVKYKQLAGGGRLKIVNPLVEMLYTNAPKAFFDHILEGKSPRTYKGLEQGTSLPAMDGYDLNVLRTSFAPHDDPKFFLSWQSHIEMMAAVQPFISGAISKTVNMPESATVEDIISAYTLAWHRGLKCVAVYRDNCKAVQPLSTKPKADGSKGEPAKTADKIEAAKAILERNIADAVASGARRKMPSHVVSMRCKFKIEGHKGYLHVGFYGDTWDIGEIFVKMSKMGSATGGFADQFCRLFSVCLQYGVSFDELYDGIVDTTFEPNGIVQDDPDVRSCRSIPDYIVQKLKALQERAKKLKALPITATEEPERMTPDLPHAKKIEIAKQIGRYSGKVCAKCGGVNVLMLGKCYFCTDCTHEEGNCYA